jgi:hypothetical protein
MRTSHRSLRPATARLISSMAVAAVLVGLAATPSVAAGGGTDPKLVTLTGTATDRDDVDGRLDIQRVRDRVVQLDRSHYLVSYRVRTFTPFGSQRLDGHYRNFDLELDRDGVAGSERTVMIVSRDGALEAQIISTATREVLATVPASRPNDRAVEISGPRRLLGAHSYFWASNFHADHSRRCGWGDGFPITCQDSVPDKGWLRLDRPAWPDAG